MKLALAGPSYSMRSRAAGVQRSVNMYPTPLESGNERAGWTLRDVPGLVLKHDFGAELRGAINVRGRLFVVAGETLWEVYSDWSKEARGTIYGAGLVGMASNSSQLAVSNGHWLFVFDLTTETMTNIVSEDYPGGTRIAYLDQFIFFIHRGSQQFGWTNVGDATVIDGLSFASAEGSPDNLVDIVADRRELILLGTDSVEVWSVVGGDDVVARNGGAFIESGSARQFTAQQCGGSIVWLGSSSRGHGRVFRLEGYQEIPVSDDAREQAIAGLDLSGASAFSVDIEGHSFYCLNIPGAGTTHVYDAKTGKWHEWAELVDGAYTPHRARLHVFAFGMHLVGAEDGRMYELSPAVHNNAGDPLCRARVFPVSATPARDRMTYGTFNLDCDRGYGGTVMLRYSNDGTAPAGEWRVTSMGAIGDRETRVKWDRCGSARDRVFEIRCTDDVPFNPVQAEVS